MCLQNNPPPPNIGGRYLFLFVQFELLRISCPLKFWLSPPPLTFELMFLACHALGACMNLQMYMYRMNPSPHREFDT